MNASVINGIEKKTGVADIVGLLAERLSGSELGSLLLAVYERRTERMKPAELLRQYCGNRLVRPAVTDMIELDAAVVGEPEGAVADQWVWVGDVGEDEEWITITLLS
ncbi:MAG TPA: hypothetical protein VHE34_07105 [Puia sp.]|uniref:hypothetical protein n=1 Tax=Puia sp. TaxID=2045100 RepID=UPI002C848AC4|nr:hypothetical protein [Puia sp.]HVU94970.1 hypothetical protein [Puia sp.]